MLVYLGSAKRTDFYILSENRVDVDNVCKPSIELPE